MISQKLNKSASKLRKNNLQSCQQTLTNLAQANKQSVDIILNQSTLSAVQGNIQKSINYLQQAIQIDTFDYRIYYNLFVIYYKNQQYSMALVNFKKCISLMYCLKFNQNPSNQLMMLVNRSIQLWPQNTVSYVFKSIYLITINQLNQAHNIIQQALQKCIIKHHIYAIACILDSKLNREAARQQNAKDYHAHLLKPITSHHIIGQNGTQQQNIQNIKQLIKQFNWLIKEDVFGKFKMYQNNNDLIFMKNSGKNTINIQLEISEKLGVCDLAFIKQNQQEQNRQANQQIQIQNINIIQQPNFQQNYQSQQNNGQNLGKDKAILKSPQLQSVSSYSKQIPAQQLLYPISSPKIQVKLLMADLQISQQLIGKLDPYVYYEYGSQKHKTTIAKGQGNQPRWHNQIKVFILQRNPIIMKISVYDREVFKWDEIVGEGKVEVIKTGQKIIPIYLNNKKSGQVLLNITKVK